MTSGSTASNAAIETPPPDARTLGVSSRTGPGAAPIQRWTIKRRLVLLVLVLAAPLNLVIFGAVWRLAKAAQDEQRASLAYTAQSLAAAVDAELGKYLALARTLSVSNALQQDDLRPFELEIRRAFTQIDDARILVADLNGQQLLNTALPTGAPPPRRSEGSRVGEKRALQAGEAIVSDAFIGAVSRKWTANIETPVFKDGKPYRILSVGMVVSAFQKLLNARKMPAGWLAGVVDSSGRLIARVPDAERFVGQFAADGLRASLGHDSMAEMPSLEGPLVVHAAVASKVSGWTIAVAVRKSEIEAAAWTTIGWAATLGGVLSALSIALAIAMARKITQPIAELREGAASLLAGSLPAPPEAPPEIADVWSALQRAANENNRVAASRRRLAERSVRIYEFSLAGIAMFDDRQRLHNCNRAFCELLGYEESELRGMHFRQLIHPDDFASDKAKTQMLRDDPKGSIEIESRYVRKDGSSVWVRKIVSTLPGDDVSARMFVLAIDISERKRAEDDLRASQRSLQAALDIADMGSWGWDEVAKVKLWSPACKAKFGLAPDAEVTRELFVSLLHPEDVPRYEKAWAAAMDPAGDRVYELEYRIRRASDGAERWISSRASVEFIGDSPVRVMGAMRDVTDDRSRIDALRENEKRFQVALGNSPVTVFEQDQDLRYVWIFNPKLGYDTAGVIGRTDAQLMDPASAARLETIKRSVIASGSPERREVAINAPDGSLQYFDVYVEPRHDPDGRVVGIICSATDLTDSKRAEGVLRQSESRLRAVLDGVREAIVAIDEHGVVQSINAAGVRMFGFEQSEIVGGNVTALMMEEEAHRQDSYIADFLNARQRSGHARNLEGRRKDGSRFPVELSVVDASYDKVRLIVGFVRDLSDRRIFEARVEKLQRERFASMGGLTAVIAHELNQPLAATGVYLDTAQRLLKLPPEQRPATVERTLEKAADQISRAGEIIVRLREFVAHGEPDKAAHSLHGLIHDVYLQKLAPAQAVNAKLELAFGVEDDNVLMDKVQIRQVLINLVRNANEAVAGSPVRRVTISTARHGDDMVRIDVSDTGAGLSDEILGKLFEPFTTTKTTGLGVGLSISRSIVEAHYGALWATRNPGGGTTFSFTLPLAEAEAEQ